MTSPEDCLHDELVFLEELLDYFKKIKYEVMVYNVQKRINKVKDKIQSLLTIETIY